MSSIPFTNTAFPPLPDRPEDPVVLDVHTIAVVLYSAPFTPADWRLMGPTRSAGSSRPSRPIHGAASRTWSRCSTPLSRPGNSGTSRT